MLNLLFPPRCLLCAQDLPRTRHPQLCSSCVKTVRPIPEAACNRCRQPFVSPNQAAHLCHKCLQPGSFDRLYCIGAYEEALAELILKLKFGHNLGIGRTLGQMLVDLDEIQSIALQYDCVVPVPLHPRSLRKRGFNQAVLMARCFTGAHHLRLDRMGLRKNQYTAAQSSLKARDRHNNLRQAFRAARCYHGESCLLIDDVFTTGTTAEACAATLKKAGALRVDVLTVARTI